MSNDKNIPKDYFSSLPDRIGQRIALLEDDLGKNAPLLASLPKSNPYRVPEGYFNSLAGRVRSRYNTMRPTRHLRTGAIAAGIALLITAGWFFLGVDREENEQMTTAEIYEYYSNHIELIDQPIIIEAGAGLALEEEALLGSLTDEELRLYEETILQEMTDQELLSIL